MQEGNENAPPAAAECAANLRNCRAPPQFHACSRSPLPDARCREPPDPDAGGVLRFSAVHAAFEGARADERRRAAIADREGELLAYRGDFAAADPAAYGPCAEGTHLPDALDPAEDHALPG